MVYLNAATIGNGVNDFRNSFNPNIFFVYRFRFNDEMFQVPSVQNIVDINDGGKCKTKHLKD